VLNLVKLARAALPCLLIRLTESFSAGIQKIFLTEFVRDEGFYCISGIRIGEPDRVKYKIVA
jgi:hypothetical protein